MYRREREALGELLGGIGPLAISLDLPSGTGRFSDILAKSADHVTLADASAAMLEVAQEDLSHLNASYLKTDAQQIDLADGSVDLVFCHRFLHHFDNVSARSRILTELVRVSRRYVVLSYYSRGPRKHLRWLLRRALLLTGAADRPLTLEQFHRETSAAGLHLVCQLTLRKLPFVAVFCLFERYESREACPSGLFRPLC